MLLSFNEETLLIFTGSPELFKIKTFFLSFRFGNAFANRSTICGALNE